MSAKLKIKKGDTVMVIAGRDRGKTGRVLRVKPAEGTLVIERLNIVKRHQKPQQGGRGAASAGGIVEKEAPLAVAKVLVLCGKCNKPTRVARKRLDDGRLVRICRHCDEQLDS